MRQIAHKTTRTKCNLASPDYFAVTDCKNDKCSSLYVRLCAICGPDFIHEFSVICELRSLLVVIPDFCYYKTVNQASEIPTVTNGKQQIVGVE